MPILFLRAVFVRLATNAARALGALSRVRPLFLLSVYIDSESPRGATTV